MRAWEIRRHRLSPEVAGEVAALRASGRLEIHAGGLEGIRTDGRRVELQLAGGGVLRGDRVVLCAGAGGVVDGTTDPLARDLLASGLAVPDAVGLGLRTAVGGALLDRGGLASRRLWTLGPLRRGELWESTAVPELRVQAADVAAQVLAAGERAAPLAV
jgi:uncharacterized NAD(P)/FAD-binding protein YdhS